MPDVEHRRFDEAAVVVLEHEPSGGRFVLEEIARGIEPVH